MLYEIKYYYLHTCLNAVTVTTNIRGRILVTGLTGESMTSCNTGNMSSHLTVIWNISRSKESMLNKIIISHTEQDSIAIK